MSAWSALVFPALRWQLCALNRPLGPAQPPYEPAHDLLRCRWPGQRAFTAFIAVAPSVPAGPRPWGPAEFSCRTVVSAEPRDPPSGGATVPGRSAIWCCPAAGRLGGPGLGRLLALAAQL